MVREVGGAQAGEQAEGKVEHADEGACGQAHGAGGDAEVGEEPESSRRLEERDEVAGAEGVDLRGWVRQSRKKWVTTRS